MEGKIGSQRIKKLNLAVQEMEINFHQNVLSSVLQFVSSLVELVDDELTNQFLKSDTMFAYERLLSIISMESIDANDYTAIEFERLLQLKKSKRRLHGVLGEIPPTTEESEMSDLEDIKIESVALNPDR